MDTEQLQEALKALDARIDNAKLEIMRVAREQENARLKTLGDLNSILQKFQKDLITGQQRLALMWNSINAIVRAFMKKRVLVPVYGISEEALLTEKDLVEAGEELFAEAQQNIQTARRAEAAGHRPIGLHPVPLEEMGKLIYPKSQKKEQTNGEGEARGDVTVRDAGEKVPGGPPENQSA